MIDHYGEPHSHLSFHRNAPAGLAPVERMIDHYGQPRPRLPPPAANRSGQRRVRKARR